MNPTDHYKRKIMVVDDDPDIIYSLKQLFEREGFNVVTADNGRKCLVELERGFQGIIVLDLMMPVMDGIETIKKMSVDGFLDNNTIIVLTAKRIQGDEFSEIDPYIYDYITKPFDINALLQIVKKVAAHSPPKKGF
jgi:CheY-like chemotaxis protein